MENSEEVIKEIEYPITKENSGVYLFYCEGCEMSHQVYTKPLLEYDNKNIVWGYNNDRVKPTFTPSILVRFPYKGVNQVCHSFVTNGNIQYLSDCTHKLAGQTIALKPDK